MMSSALTDYIAPLLGIVTFGSPLSLLKTIFIWLGLLHAACILGVMVLLWWEEHRWPHEKVHFTTPTPWMTIQSATQQEISRRPSDELSDGKDAQRILEARAAELTNRISSVYPLVPYEEIYTLVWTVLNELNTARMPTQALGHSSSEKNHRVA